MRVQVKARQFWGDMVYTHDSDLVAVLMHMGYYAHNLPQAPQQLVETRAIIRLVPSLPVYPSKVRYVKSREWHKPSDVCAYKVGVCSRDPHPRLLSEDLHTACIAPTTRTWTAGRSSPLQSFKNWCWLLCVLLQVERFWLVTRSGSVVEMQPCVDDLPAPQATVQPQASDRAITTRNTGARGRVPQEATIQYSLSNEPWLKYTLATVADKGLKPSQLTSARLIDHVLYVETARWVVWGLVTPARTGTSQKHTFVMHTQCCTHSATGIHHVEHNC